MAHGAPPTERIPCYCALCVSRCGSIAVVEGGRFIALEPDPTHPTGQALCAKGRAAPELVYHPDRLLHPLKRTRPKGDPDPGWQRISWNEALDLTAARLRQLAEESGPESVAFALASPSTSASADSMNWVERLVRAFGSPNFCVSMELCGWGRYLATVYTYGTSVPGVYMPDIENAGCVLFWGYNPTIARLAHAVSTVDALKRGTRLIVVDPRRAGLAGKADLWLQVRPGTDGALALGITHTMIERGWFDADFIRGWTNGPLLVRSDDGRLLREADLLATGHENRYIAWNAGTDGPLLYDPARGTYEPIASDPTRPDRWRRTEALASWDGPARSRVRRPADGVDEADSLPTPDVHPALSGAYELETPRGTVVCRPAFDLVADLCRRNSPDRVENICGVPAARIESAARMLWESRPVAYYAWSGVEQQTNATQIARAIAQLYALTGSFDERGGNVRFAGVPTANVADVEPRPRGPLAPAIGFAERPLGPARWHFVTTDDLYRAILEKKPYPVRGLVDFGSNLLLSHADGRRGREALASLDFYVHADLFMNPTAELADVVLPVASAFEREALKAGFEVSAEAQTVVQFRKRVAEPQGESRSDMEIVFELARRLGLGEEFWDGDIDAGYRYELGPSGISLEALRVNPAGIRVPVQTRYRKYAERVEGVPAGFPTRTRKIELYSESLLEHGYPPIPEYEEPLVSPRSRPDLAARFPLILTSTKHTLFCESQHRSLPSLRRLARDPEVELHPAAAAERGIAAGDWVSIETPAGSVRARARLNDALMPDVVCGQHGWWEACPEIGAPGYDAFSDDGANLNLIIGNDAIDPISGSVPHRAYLCEVRSANSSGS
jgi:anaerobic selenocysteine-containing dehydrogenase